MWSTFSAAPVEPPRCAAFARAGPDGEAPERDAEPAKQQKFEARDLAGKIKAERGQRKRNQKHDAERNGGAKMRAQQQERVHERVKPNPGPIAEPAIALWDRMGFRGMVVRASRVASRISADLRSVCADASHGVNDGSRGTSHTQQEAVQVIRTVPFVVLLGYCFVSACDTRFTAEGPKFLAFAGAVDAARSFPKPPPSIRSVEAPQGQTVAYVRNGHGRRPRPRRVEAPGPVKAA